MKRIFAVLLAAGLSERLGANKLLVRIDGVPVIRRALIPLLSSPVESVIVVTSPENSEIRQALEGLSVEFVVNPDFREGMGSSVRAALPSLGGCDGALFHLGDKPFVTAGLVRTLVERFDAEGGRIVVPVHRGQRGHPVLVDMAAFREEIASAAGDRGLRDMIEKECGHVICIEAEEGCLLDIDTTDDITVLRGRGFTIEEG
jgi:molybdenum cofactor cytidylyltransferase